MIACSWVARLRVRPSLFVLDSWWVGPRSQNRSRGDAWAQLGATVRLRVSASGASRSSKEAIKLPAKSVSCLGEVESRLKPAVDPSHHGWRKGSG